MISLNVPASEALSLNAYTAVDAVYGVTLGGRITYRIPLGGQFVRDPNRQDGSSGTRTSASNGRLEAALKSVSEKSHEPTAASMPTRSCAQRLQWPGNNPIEVIGEGCKAVFNAKGELLEIVPMTAEEIARRIKSALSGFDPLPESYLLARAAKHYGVSDSELDAMMGLAFYEIGMKPISITNNTPFSTDRFPTASYACAATSETKKYIENTLRNDGRDEAADRVRDSDEIFFGTRNGLTEEWPTPFDAGGPSIVDEWPVTANKSRAYRFAGGSECEEVNSRVRDYKKYKGPSQPTRRVRL